MHRPLNEHVHIDLDSKFLIKRLCGNEDIFLSFLLLLITKVANLRKERKQTLINNKNQSDFIEIYKGK